MDLYLVQHGEARAKEEDPERSLSDAGRANAVRMAAWARSVGVRVDEIHHSGKVRAAQTAEILAAALAPRAVSKFEGLAPNDDVHLAAEYLLGVDRPVMLVGHLPHLSRLASLLLAGAPEPAVVRFRNAGIVHLSHADGRWTLEWTVTPELAAHLAEKA